MLSLPVREVWIEIVHFATSSRTAKSLPVREVWIEISTHAEIAVSCVVTSREGSVDWNPYVLHCQFKCSRHFPWGKCGLKSNITNRPHAISIVTSREGSVDWNFDICCHAANSHTVTSREGSVDWNFFEHFFGAVWKCHFPWGKCGLKSLSAAYSLQICRHFPWGKCGLKFRNWLNP